jgi:hypothetical protein
VLTTDRVVRRAASTWPLGASRFAAAWKLSRRG